MTEFIRENWDKLAAFIFGGGVMYGLAKNHVERISTKLSAHDQALHDMGDRMDIIDEELQDHMMNCPTRIHEKLNKIAEDVSFMRGRLAGKNVRDFNG